MKTCLRPSGVWFDVYVEETKKKSNKRMRDLRDHVEHMLEELPWQHAAGDGGKNSYEKADASDY